MARVNSYLLLFSAIVLGAGAVLFAQSEPPDSSHARPIPAPVDVGEASARHSRQISGHVSLPNSLPFSIDNNGETVRSIQVLSQDEMSRADRDLVADAQASIQERAGFSNLDFDGEGWTYQQLVCTALPKHLFLRFRREDGTREMSMFSAAIPRDGNGRVHVIPIVRKGYSLFSPTPIAAMTVSAFNRIRAEEGIDAAADWLGTGLCYAALSGANPRIGEMAGNESTDAHATFPPTLTINAQGGAVISFVDVSSMPNPMQWSITFDPKGKLLKAEHSAAYTGHFEKSKTTVQHPDQANP